MRSVITESLSTRGAPFDAITAQKIIGTPMTSAAIATRIAITTPKPLRRRGGWGRGGTFDGAAGGRDDIRRPPRKERILCREARRVNGQRAGCIARHARYE